MLDSSGVYIEQAWCNRHAYLSSSSSNDAACEEEFMKMQHPGQLGRSTRFH